MTPDNENPGQFAGKVAAITGATQGVGEAGGDDSQARQKRFADGEVGPYILTYARRLGRGLAAGGFDLHVEVEQDAGGQPLLRSQESQQEMRAARAVMAQFPRLRAVLRSKWTPAPRLPTTTSMSPSPSTSPKAAPLLLSRSSGVVPPWGFNA